MKHLGKLLSGLFLAGACASSAQPFVVTLSGVVPNCALNTVVEIYGPPGALGTAVVLDGTCTFTATFETFAPAGEVLVSGLCANGSQAFAQVPFQFDQQGDTLSLLVSLVCASDVVDCTGITGGGNLPGAPCDDGNAATLVDSWGVDCQCAGIDSSLVVFDCSGVPNGPNLPGTPCIVDPGTYLMPIGIWSSDCLCIADTSYDNFTDCLGVVNGPNVSGSPCDDGDPNTTVDLWDAACACMGYDSTQVVFDCTGVVFGGNLPGTPCIVDPALPVLPIGIWNANCECIADTTWWGTYDCLGIANGPNVPGSSCDDGNASTTNDVWFPGCFCTGTDTTATTDCLGVPNGTNNPGTPCYAPDAPFAVGYWDLNCVCVIDTLGGPVDCLGIPGGPNMPGLPCSLLPDSSITVVGIWGPDCICYANTFDCLGIPGGNNLPGTICQGTAQDGSVYFGVWGSDCFCVGDSGTVVLDCLNQPNGPVLPGTPCIPANEFPFAIIGTWSPDCQCLPDSSLFYTDCLGIENGPNTIGSVCDTGDPNVLGYWNNACQCEAYTMPPCTAGFIITPGIIDSAGIDPVQLWIWNTSYGGSGIYTYSWDFGDGTSSTDPWPMHDYEGNGPYALCLTIADSDGCTSTYCDTLLVDENGMFDGLQAEGNRSNGFSIRVQPGESPTGFSEQDAPQVIELWPNPATDQVSISMTATTSGNVELTVLDVDGRSVLTDRSALSVGENNLVLNTKALRSGLYVVRISAAGKLFTSRIVITE